MKEKTKEAIAGVIFILLMTGVIMLLTYMYISEPMPEYETVSEIESAQAPTVASSEPLQATQSKETMISLGMFKVTHYCPCIECCGKSNGITASGVLAIPNHTIAAPSEFEFGTVLIINGTEYTVEDRGGAITENRIDIFVNSHDMALKMGTYEVEVFQKIN